MKKLLAALSIWLALTGTALAQCTGGISACPAATSVNPSDLTLVAQAGGTGPTGYVTRKATIQQLTAGVASTLLASNNVFTGTNSFTNTFLVSGAAGFSGGLTSLTPSPGDNSGTVATTAFVQAALTASVANIFTTPHTWTALQTFNGGIAGSGPVGMINTTVPASFTTPAYAFNDVGVTGFNFSDGSLHYAVTMTGNSPATGSGGYVALNVTQFGVGRGANAFVVGSIQSAVALGGSGHYFGANPYVVVCGTAVVAGQCALGTAATLSSATGMEVDFFGYAGGTTVYKEGVRITDQSVIQASGAGNLSTAITIARISTAPGFVYGLYFGDPTMGDNFFPLTTTGSAIKLSTTARAIDSIIDGSGLAGGVTNGAFRLPDTVALVKWPSWSILETSSLIAIQTSGAVNAALIQTTATLFSGTLSTGNPGTNAGALLILPAVGLGSITQVAPTPLASVFTITWGSASGTPAVTASSPLAINTSTGNISITSPLPVANGGTGIASGTSGGVLAFTATGTIASSALLGANCIVVGGGAGVVPATSTSTCPTVSAAGVVAVANATAATTGGAGALTVAGGAFVSGGVIGAGAAHIFGSNSNTTTSVSVVGNNSGTNSGAQITVQAPSGTNILAFGNFSAVLGNATYSGNPTFFATSTLGFYINSVTASLTVNTNGTASTTALTGTLIVTGGVGITGALFVNGALNGTLASATGTNAVCNTPGTATALTVQVWATGCAASSERFKRDIIAVDPTKALADVVAFRAVSYYYRPEFSMGNDLHVGFTAEQVGAIDRQWITFEQDGLTPHAVKYNEMAPLLAAAIQQLKADNDNLRAEVRALRTGTR